VRDYLLGKLDEDSANSLEERYFTDRASLLEVDAVEAQLIESYLKGGLSPDDRARFEEQYRPFPQRWRKVSDARARMEQGVRQKRSRRYAPLILAVAASVVVVTGILVYPGSQRNSLRIQVNPMANSPVKRAPTVAASPRADPGLLVSKGMPVLMLHLAPGVQMGGVEGLRVLQLPALRSQIKLILELPGQTANIACSGTVAMIMADGSRNPAWRSADDLQSQAAEGGQVVTLEFASSVLTGGDYEATISAVGTVIQRYQFRASPSR